MWLTTKDGRHFNTDWIDKEKQIARNQSQADELNGKLNNPQDLIDKNSYVYEENYASASKILSDALTEREPMNKELVDLYKQRDKEVVVDPALGRELSKALGNYTEKGREIDMQIKELQSREKQLDDTIQAMQQRMKSVSRIESEKQYEKYINTPTTVSGNVKENYPGFNTKESTVPYVDEKLAKGQAYVVEMSPKQYLQESAYNIFKDSTLERQVQATAADNYANPKKYAKMMREGTKFHTPYLNYADNQQEGRNRAVAAFINGYEKIPVIIIPKKR